MNLPTLLVLVAAAASPRVEISTVSGEQISGQLTSIADGAWKLEVDGKSVEVAGSQILKSKLFVAGQTAPEKEPLEILLTDGSLLHVKQATADSKKVVAQSALTGEMEFPRNFVRSLRFAASPSSVDESWQELIARDTRQDMIVVRKNNGQNDVLDFVEGVVGEISDTRVNVLLDSEPIAIGRDKLFGLVFYQRNPGRARSPVQIELLNGDRLQTRGVTSSDGAGLTVSLVSGPEITVAADQVKTIDFSSGRLAWLDEMKLRDKKHEFEIIDVVPDFKVNRDIYGSRLKVGQRTFDRGLCIRSKTMVQYRLDGDYKRFQTWVGIQDGYAGDVTVTISCDGKELFSGGIEPDTEAQRLDLDVAGKFTLEVLVDFGKVESDIGDHLVLGEARLLK